MGEILRDKNGRKIGEIKTSGHNRLVGEDANGRKVGEFNCRTGETLDKNGRRVGMGNLLAGLMYKDK